MTSVGHEPVNVEIPQLLNAVIVAVAVKHDGAEVTETLHRVDVDTLPWLGSESRAWYSDADISRVVEVLYPGREPR